jgi:hypothetical protein
MQHTTVQQSEKGYTCLSYVWGPTGSGLPTEVNEQIFMARRNLDNFLKAAHEMQQSTGTNLAWLWIDALCIDQSNPRERNHQVQQMATIYSSASNIIAWLGIDVSVARFLWKCCHAPTKGSGPTPTIALKPANARRSRR